MLYDEGANLTAIAQGSFDVMIIGGGIVGCACARECALAGMTVAVVEPSVSGEGATAAAMGHLVTLDDSPAQLALTAYALSVWRELLPQLPAEVEYERRGTVWIAADDEEFAELHAKQNRFAAAGVNIQLLDAQTLAIEEPNLRPGLAGGLLVAGDGVVHPSAASAFFLQEAVHAGATVFRGVRATHAGRKLIHLSNGDVYGAGQIVVATGVDTSLAPGMKLVRRKGHLVLTDRYPGFIRHQLVELGYLKSTHAVAVDSVAFNVQPRQGGQVLIGSSRQTGNEDPAVEESVLKRMLDRAYGYMPGLAQLATVRAWTGFRAATADKLPILGPSEDASVFLAMGFEGLGITSAPGAARLIVDHLLGRRSAIDCSPYLASRFWSVAKNVEMVHA